MNVINVGQTVTSTVLEICRTVMDLLVPLPHFLFFQDSWDNLNDVYMCMQLCAEHTEVQICMLSIRIKYIIKIFYSEFWIFLDILHLHISFQWIIHNKQFFFLSFAFIRRFMVQETQITSFFFNDHVLNLKILIYSSESILMYFNIFVVCCNIELTI
jgi:hypothetical protein